MTEMMGVTIVIGGNIEHEKWCEFIEAFEELALFDDYGIYDGRLTGSGESNYGDTSAVQSLCEEYNLSYRASSDARYEYDGDVTVYHPGMAESQTRLADQSGNAAVTLDSLKEAHDAGRTLADLIVQFQPFLQPIPNLLIDGKRATDANLADRPEYEEESACSSS